MKEETKTTERVGGRVGERYKGMERAYVLGVGCGSFQKALSPVS